MITLSVESPLHPVQSRHHHVPNTFFKFIFYFRLRRVTCGILVPQPGIETPPPVLGARSPNHWAPRGSHTLLHLQLYAWMSLPHSGFPRLCAIAIVGQIMFCCEAALCPVEHLASFLASTYWMTCEHLPPLQNRCQTNVPREAKLPQLRTTILDSEIRG